MHLTVTRRHSARRPSSLILFVSLLALAALAAAQTLPLTRRVDASDGPHSRLSEGAGEKAGPRAWLSDSYGKLPLRFEVNRGQAPRDVRFLSRGSGYSLLLTQEGVVLNLFEGAAGPAIDENGAPSAPASTALRAGTLRFNLVGSKRRPRIVGLGELEGKSNYLIGDDPRAWRAGVENFEKVKYEAVYPGVDLVYYGNQGQLEYDFVVAPGANPARIGMTFEGTLGARIDEGGDLILPTEAGDVRQRKPFAYQEVGGRRREVAARYVKDAGGAIRFRLGAYDRRLPLVIDPILIYSTYLGGGAADQGRAVAVGADGSAYVAGYTLSTDLPTSGLAKGGFTDAFVLKLSPDGKSLVYATYLGGDINDFASGLAADEAGNAYVTGLTHSGNFPGTPGALQEAKDAAADAFVAKLNPTGSSLVYSTFFGGNIYDEILGVAVDAAGNAYVAGRTESTHFKSLPASRGRSGHPVSKSADAAASWSASSAGLASAAVFGLAIAPSDSSVLYAATNDGVFKSTDAGANWTLAGGGNPAAAPPFAVAVAVHPSNPSVVYAGGPANGVFKSTDGGTSFEKKGNGIFGSVRALLVDPANPSTLYAGTSSGVYKSVNGGDNWSLINDGLLPPTSVSLLAFDPSNSSVIYAGALRGMFKSTNAGGSWFEITNGMRTPNGTPGPTALAVSQSSPQTLYVGTAGLVGGVFKSTDGGANWSLTGKGQNLRLIVFALAVDPTDASTVYAGTSFDVYKSTDGGTNWVPSSAGITTRSARALAIDSHVPSTVYAGLIPNTDAFVAKLNPAGSALHYFTLLGGFETDYALDVAIDSAGNAYVGGGTFSRNFPLAAPFQSSPGGGASTDAFVAKVGADGTSLIYSTYLGGSTIDAASGVAVDAQGSAYVTGLTGSSDFPLANPLQPTKPGSFDVFVTKFSPDGASLVYSTHLGGSRDDEGLDIAVDAQGSAYVTGLTISDDFPVLQPVQARGNPDDAFVAKLNPAGSALVYSTYLGGHGTEVGNSIAVDDSGNAYVVGSTTSTNFPVASPLLSQSAGGGDAFIVKLGAGAELAFTESPYFARESDGSLEVSVRRLGDTSGHSTVDYTTTNGTASDLSDYTAAVGTLRFAPGETQKSFKVLLTDDALVESFESLGLVLSNPKGARLGSLNKARLDIMDNDSNPAAPNPVNASRFFVRQHYHDFLSRVPDASGLEFWANEIESCGANALCREIKRINVSAAFFLSIEFQETGYLVERMYKAAYGDSTGTSGLGGSHQLRVPVVRLREFLPDTQRIGLGVVVNQGAWREQLEANKQAYALEFVQRQRFASLYPPTMTAEEFVAKLDQNTGGVLAAADRAALVATLSTNPSDAARRAEVVRATAENEALSRAEFNRAFVLMQYFGYLRRDPDAAPDADYTGYEFWLQKLDQFGGNFIQAEMVKAFLNSDEYRKRFGQ